MCRAMDDHAYRPGVAAAAPAPPLPTVHRSDPNGHASVQSEISRASPECLQTGFDLFMRLVLASKFAYLGGSQRHYEMPCPETRRYLS